MSSAQVLLSLGSNRCFYPAGSTEGMEPRSILQAAVGKLRSVLENIVFSSVYRTEPMYFTDQSSFLNMAVAGQFAFSGEIEDAAYRVLEVCHKIEATLGRDRSHEVRNGPRTLDIDIVLFGEAKINDASLVVPHERMMERAFVLVPALEILASPTLAALDHLSRKLPNVSSSRVSAPLETQTTSTSDTPVSPSPAALGTSSLKMSAIPRCMIEQMKAALSKCKERVEQIGTLY